MTELETGEVVAIFSFFLCTVCCSTLLYLPPLRFYWVGGCLDRTQNCRDVGIDRRSNNHSARCHPHSARSHPLEDNIFTICTFLCQCPGFCRRKNYNCSACGLQFHCNAILIDFKRLSVMLQKIFFFL
jgi:hypothetical protein